MICNSKECKWNIDPQKDSPFSEVFIKQGCSKMGAMIEDGKCNGYEPKPKQIERLSYNIEFSPGDRVDIAGKLIETIKAVNELIDAVNELRQERASSK
jgi:hypothetical protein